MSTIGMSNGRKGRGHKVARRWRSRVVAKSQSSDRANGRKAQCREAKNDRIDDKSVNFRNIWPESHRCVDCGFDTASGLPNRARAEEAAIDQIAVGIEKWSIPMEYNPAHEFYFVHDHVWKASGIEPFGGCLCIGCLEKQIARRLTPDDFPDIHMDPYLQRRD